MRPRRGNLLSADAYTRHRDLVLDRDLVRGRCLGRHPRWNSRSPQVTIGEIQVLITG